MLAVVMFSGASVGQSAESFTGKGALWVGGFASYSSIGGDILAEGEDNITELNVHPNVLYCMSDEIGRASCRERV